MMGRLAIGLCVFLFASANAFHTLIPEGKELVYNYRGLVRATTHSPVTYGSAFILDGQLHVQTDKNSSFMHLSNLKFKLFNGEHDMYAVDFDTKQIDLPKELEAFEHPFKVVYMDCGHAMGIAVEKDEPEYIVNVKRGLASIMQLDTHKVKWEEKQPYGFHTKEHTLYGKGPYYYTVYPGAEDTWTVKKMAEPHSNYHMYSFLSTNVQMCDCEAKFDEPLARDSVQEYTFVKKDGCHVMASMESNAGIYYTPYSGEGYNFYLYMNQTLVLDKVVDAATPMTIKSEKFHKGLTYNTADHSNMQPFTDFLHGRRTFDMDKILVELEAMLCDTQKYVHEFHIDMKSPDWARGQLINRMLILMYPLDEAHLEEMAAKLMQKTSDEGKEILHIYYHMLPMVGSHCSYMYMMKLIKTKKIKDRLAVEWLHNMPFYVKEPNKMLIEHMSEMLNLGDEICLDVRRAAISAFGTFIEKAMFRHNKINHINNWTGYDNDKPDEEDFSPDLELDEVYPGEDCYNKYVDLLGEKMKSCVPEMRITYMSALYNTRLAKAAEYLMPIVRSELFQDDQYARFIAIKTLGGIINHDKELVKEVFWPIMTNYELCKTIRVAAMEQIMDTRPCLQVLNNMFWQMSNEPDYAVYQIYYTYLTSVADSTDPCIEDFKKSVKQILAYTTPPEVYGLERYYEVNYMDEKYQNGHQFRGIIIHSSVDHETTMEFHMSQTMDNAKFHLFGLLIHVDGLESSIFEDVMLHMKDPNHSLNLDLVWKAYKNIYQNKDFHIDITVLGNGQVTSIYHFDASNIKDLPTLIDFIVSEKANYVKKYFNIAYPLQTIVILPSDIGFPALFKVHMPCVSIYDIKITKEIVNNMITLHSDTHLKKWAHGRIGLNIYNPFIDMYQGVQRMNAFDWHMPLYFDLSINPAQSTMKFSWKRHEDPQKDTFGLKSYAATFTFFRDDFNKGLLKQSCPEAENWKMVSFGKEYRNDHVLLEEDCPNTGFNYKVAQFDSDKCANKMPFLNKFNFLHSDQSAKTELGHWFLTRFHALMLRVFQRHPYASGILVRYEPSKVYPVTSVDLNVRFNKEYERGHMLLTPATKWNFRGTYNVQNKEETVKSWDANIVVDANEGRTTQCVKAVISHSMQGQHLRMCIDFTRKHVAEGIESDATISFGLSAGTKCTEDEKIIEIKTKAEKLPEQLDNKHIYGVCEEEMWSDIVGMRSLACYKARDTLRKWTLDMKTVNIPAEIQNYLNIFRDWRRAETMEYMTEFGEPTTPMDKNCQRMVFEYPLSGNSANLHVYTPELEFEYAGIPAEKNIFYDIHNYATQHFPATYSFMHKMGWTRICQVDQDCYYNSTGNMVKFDMPHEWTMYLGDADTDAKHGLWMKNLEGDYIAMKMQHGEHCLEIIPTGKRTYDIIVDGQKLPANTFQHESKWFWVDVIKETGVVSVVCMHTGGHIVFDGKTVLTENPNIDMACHGVCA